MKILIIDNYDSFSYNLYHMVEANLPAGWVVDIKRNDGISVEAAGRYDKIIISPGPGLPEEAGISKEVIRTYYQKKSILGVCLGLQAIAEVFGGKLHNLDKVLHGVTVPARIIQRDYLFSGCPRQFDTGRYHSWVADRATFSKCLQATVVDDDLQIMALRHRTYDVRAVQFHPESILTPEGEKILRNWIQEKPLQPHLSGSLVEINPFDSL